MRWTPWVFPTTTTPSCIMPGTLSQRYDKFRETYKNFKNQVKKGILSNTKIILKKPQNPSNILTEFLLRKGLLCNMLASKNQFRQSKNRMTKVYGVLLLVYVCTGKKKHVYSYLACPDFFQLWYLNISQRCDGYGFIAALIFWYLSTFLKFSFCTALTLQRTSSTIWVIVNYSRV